MTKQFVKTEQLLYHVNATDNTNRRAWYCLLVQPEKLTEFRKKLLVGSLVLSNYGEVLASGYGEAMPENIKSLLEERFGNTFQN